MKKITNRKGQKILFNSKLVKKTYKLMTSDTNYKFNSKEVKQFKLVSIFILPEKDNNKVGMVSLYEDGAVFPLILVVSPQFLLEKAFEWKVPIIPIENIEELLKYSTLNTATGVLMNSKEAIEIIKNLKKIIKRSINKLKDEN